jgi:signal transduction histidine kinase
MELPSSTAYVDVAGLQEENMLLKRMLINALTRSLEEEKVGRVFHDFNNILSSSMGYASLALERSESVDDPKLCRYLENIERAGIRSRDLVRERLAERKAIRDANQCKLIRLFEEIAPKSLTGEEEVFLDEYQLAYVFGVFTGFESFASDELEFLAELVDEPVCSGCSSELRGQQWRIQCNRLLAPEVLTSKTEYSLARLVVNSSGGHLCKNLVQDEQVVVYLRAVAPQN